MQKKLFLLHRKICLSTPISCHRVLPTACTFCLLHPSHPQCTSPTIFVSHKHASTTRYRTCSSYLFTCTQRPHGAPMQVSRLSRRCGETVGAAVLFCEALEARQCADSIRKRRRACVLQEQRAQRRGEERARHGVAWRGISCT